MRKSTKIWLIVASSLLLIGCVIFAGVMTVLEWDFLKLSTQKYETNSYKISDDFKNITIDIDDADVIFIPSDSSDFSVECYEQTNAKHSVAIKNGTLSIEVESTKKWYDYVGINVGSPKIKIFIPQGEYSEVKIHTDTGDVTIPAEYSFSSIDISVSTGTVTNHASASGKIKIKASTGDICVEKVSGESFDISVSTGDVSLKDLVSVKDVTVTVSSGKSTLTNVKCYDLISSGNTGDITLKNVIATGKFSITRSTGHVIFDASDAAEINVKTNTGDVKGTLLSEKIFIVDTSTGDKNVPSSLTGGECSITTSTGDICISIQQ